MTIESSMSPEKEPGPPQLHLVQFYVNSNVWLKLLANLPSSGPFANNVDRIAKEYMLRGMSPQFDSRMAAMLNEGY